MKTSLVITTTLLACLSMPALAADTDKKTDTDNANIKALEAEIAALRAQLKAESQIRGEDRSREGGHRSTDSDTKHHGEHDEDGGHTSQFEYVYELDGDLRDAPLGMIRSQLGGMPAGSESMIVINGKEVSLEQFMEMTGNGHGHDDEGRHAEREHRVMHFDLGDMTGGEVDGEIHIEIAGDMDRVPGFLPELIMSQMDGHGGQPMMFQRNGGPMGPGGNHPFVVFGPTDERMHDGMMDEGHLEAIHMAVMETMDREYPDGQRMFDEVHEEMARHGGMDPFEAMELLIQRLEEHGQDPHPLIQLRDEIMHGMHGMGGGGEHDDPFFHEGSEFVGKLELSDEIATRLSDSKSVAILCIWEARQHLEPQERLDVLFPIMADEDIDMNVRNAAAMVVREAFVELGDREKALETLQTQIRLNGLRIPMN